MLKDTSPLHNRVSFLVFANCEKRLKEFWNDLPNYECVVSVFAVAASKVDPGTGASLEEKV